MTFPQAILHRSAKLSQRALIASFCAFLMLAQPALAQNASSEKKLPETTVASASTPAAGTGLYHTVWQIIVRNSYDVSELKSWSEKEHEFDSTFSQPGMEDAYATLLMPMVHSPYANLLEPEQMQALNEKFDAQKASIAITLPEKWGDHALFSRGTRTAAVPLLSVGVHSTAQAAGLVAGDNLIAVNGLPVSQIDFGKIAGLFEGEVGSNVSLTILHKGTKRDVTIKRELIVDHLTTYHKLGRDIEFINLTSFVPATTVGDVQAAFDEGKDARIFEINLASNHGGQLENAISVASMFVKEGVLLSIRTRVDSDLSNPKYVTDSYEVTATELLKKELNEATGQTVVIARQPREPYRLNHRAVVLLVDGQTASASELTIGAIKDHAGTVNGASSVVLIGEKTFGKGIGQGVFSPLPGGYGMTLTTFHYFTPSGYWIGDGDVDKRGFTPSVKAIGQLQRLSAAKVVISRWSNTSEAYLSTDS